MPPEVYNTTRRFNMAIQQLWILMILKNREIYDGYPIIILYVRYKVLQTIVIAPT